MSHPDLVLIVADMNVPLKINDIPEQFKSLLVPNKIQHVVSLGNIGNKESYDWLKGLSKNFHSVRGEYDDSDIQETKVISIGSFKIGLIHGHQVVPWGDIESLSFIQRQLDCDILLSGSTHISSVKLLNGKYFLNPGSLSGSFSVLNPDPIPSFILMVIQDDYAIVYLYELPDRNKKFEVSKMEFKKNSNELKNSNDEDEE